jgi:hypothetical protein
MAAYEKSLTIEQGNSLLCACQGLKISHAHRGAVSPVLFLELGRLHEEVLKLRTHRKPLRLLNGQITCMIESDWRIEKPRSIQSGSGFSDRKVDGMLKTMIGRRIAVANLVGRLPELQIELDDGRIVSTFTNWTNQPRWLVGFNDVRLFTLQSLPPAADISPWMHFQRGRLEVQYCFDDRNLVAKQYIRQLSRTP